LEGEDEPDSWELPTAVSGLIQLPDALAREIAPSAVRPQPGPAPRADQGANDTQPSIAPGDSDDGSGNREPTTLSTDIKPSRRGEPSHRSRPQPNSVKSPEADPGTGISPVGMLEDKKRQLLLAGMVVVLVVLSFFAGRL
jgi:hypothetical protein